MLILIRKEGERIAIGQDIVITVVECFGESVRLGITAPQEMPVRREEVVEEISQVQASQSVDDYREGSPFYPECS
jgi:carbon storage regulator